MGTKKALTIDTSSKIKKSERKKFTPTYRKILKNTSSLFWFHICINILNIIKIF